MSDNNIDNIFKNAASQYSAPAPKSSWSTLDSALKKQRKARSIRIVSVAATFFVVVISSLIITFNVDEENIADVQQIEPVIEKTTVDSKPSNIDVTENKSTIDNNTVVENTAVENNDIIVSKSNNKPIKSENITENSEAKDLFSKKNQIAEQNNIVNSEANTETKSNIGNTTENVNVSNSDKLDNEDETAKNNIVAKASLRELVVSESYNNDIVTENSENIQANNSEIESVNKTEKENSSITQNENEKTINNNEVESNIEESSEEVIVSEEK